MTIGKGIRHVVLVPDHKENVIGKRGFLTNVSLLTKKWISQSSLCSVFDECLGLALSRGKSLHLLGSQWAGWH